MFCVLRTGPLRTVSAYDITEVLRTAYRAFAYCVKSKKLKTAYQRGGGYPPKTYLWIKLIKV